MTNLTLPIFTDSEKAREHLEALHWPDGPICPTCGVLDQATLIQGKSHRPGLYQCNACRVPFTVTVGTVMEKSHIPLNKWVLGFHLMAASKKGVAAHQLMRMLGLGSYRTAWFMAHRIREAMAPAKFSDPLGGPGKVVEVDETELSPSKKSKPRRRSRNKKFVSLVERGGKARSVVIDGGASRATLRAAIEKHVRTESTLHTDGAPAYRQAGLPQPFGYMAKHEAVDHNKMWTRKGEKHTVHTNTAEGYFSLFKRGLVGTYQHIGEQHLPRYLAEFDFRQNNRVRLGVDDTMRAERAMKAARGKRLTYYTVSG